MVEEFRFVKWVCVYMCVRVRGGKSSVGRGERRGEDERLVIG